MVANRLVSSDIVNSMINFEFSNKSFESQFVPLIEGAYAEACELLNDDPLKHILIKFTDNGASEDTGVGGFALSSRQLNLAVLEGYRDINTQRENLLGVVYHELLHIHQGFTYEEAPFTAMEAAMYEGSSIIFEQQYAGASASYGDYRQHSEQELNDWLEEIRSVGVAYFEDSAVWGKWAFYHSEYEQKWLIYKVGSWHVGRILQENNLDVLDLKDMRTEQILALSRSS